MIKKILLYLIAIINLFGIKELYSWELRTAAQDSFPKYYLENNKMKGLCVDIIKAVEKESRNIKFIGYNKFIPFKRIQKYLEIGEIDIFFGLKKTKEREKKYIFLDEVPLYKLNYILCVRRDDDVKVDSLENIWCLKDNIILTLYGSASYNFLRKYPYLSVKQAKSLNALLKMLVLKRGRFIFYHDLGLINTVKKYNFEHKVKFLPKSFDSYYHYVVVSKYLGKNKVEKFIITILI